MHPLRSLLLLPLFASLAIVCNAARFVACGVGDRETHYLEVSDIKKNVYRIEKHNKKGRSVCYTKKSETKCKLWLYWLKKEGHSTCYVSMAGMEKKSDYPLETIISSLFAEQEQETSADVSSSQDASALISSSQDASALISTPQFFMLDEKTAVSLEVQGTQFLCYGNRFSAFYGKEIKLLHEAPDTATCNDLVKAFLAAQEKATKEQEEQSQKKADEKIAEEEKRQLRKDFALAAYQDGKSLEEAMEWVKLLWNI